MARWIFLTRSARSAADVVLEGFVIGLKKDVLGRGRKERRRPRFSSWLTTAPRDVLRMVWLLGLALVAAVATPMLMRSTLGLVSRPFGRLGTRTRRGVRDSRSLVVVERRRIVQSVSHTSPRTG